MITTTVEDIRQAVELSGMPYWKLIFGERIPDSGRIRSVQPFRWHGALPSSRGTRR